MFKVLEGQEAKKKGMLTEIQRIFRLQKKWPNVTKNALNALVYQIENCHLGYQKWVKNTQEVYQGWGQYQINPWTNFFY